VAALIGEQQVDANRDMMFAAMRAARSEDRETKDDGGH